MPRWLRTLLITLAIVVGVCVAGLAACAWTVNRAFDEATKVTTEVSAYPALLKDWSPTGLVDHFARTIPSQAINVSLPSFPGFMQGWGWFQLRMTLPPEEVEAIKAGVAAKAVRTCPPQCTTTIEDPEFWNVPRPQAGGQEYEFQADFIVYALETDGDWNHSTGKGIAVSTARREVVYWADP